MNNKKSIPEVYLHTLLGNNKNEKSNEINDNKKIKTIKQRGKHHLKLFIIKKKTNVVHIIYILY